MEIEISKTPQQKQLPNSTRLHKLITFIDYHSINYPQIWDNKSRLSILQFSIIIQQKYGYKISTDELLALQNISQKQDYLYPDNFHQFGIWKTALYQINKSSRYKKGKCRPYTAKQSSRSPRIKLTEENNKQEFSRVVGKCQQTQNTQIYENSRLKVVQQKLQKKILENTLDKKWQYVIKVGQINNWLKISKHNQQSNYSQQLQKQNIKSHKQFNKISKLYKIYGDNQNIQIIQQKQDGTSQSLPLKVFDQKYQSMKKKCTIQQKKNNMKGTMLLVLDKKQKVSKIKLGQKISQRDQQLNYLLLEIIRLKNIFQQQQLILNQCGVNC